MRSCDFGGWRTAGAAGRERSVKWASRRGAASLFAVWLVACTGTVVAIPDPWFEPVVPAPLASTQGGDTVDRARPVIVADGRRLAAVYLEGWLPTPCHRPEAQVEVEQAAKRARVTVGARAPADYRCARAPTPYAWLLPIAGADPADGPWTLVVDGRELRVPSVPGAASSVFLDAVETAGGGLTVTGKLPTPCHVPRLSRRADAGARSLAFELDAVSDADLCAAALEPFRLVLPLDPPAPDARVTVNGRRVE